MIIFFTKNLLFQKNLSNLNLRKSKLHSKSPPKEIMKHTHWLLLLLLSLPACTNPDLGSNALAITSPASGTSVSGTVAVQIGIAENTTATRIDLYVRGQGSTNKGMMVGSSVSEPHVISWNSLSQPNATNLELL
jgi:hypothetical protein